ncbi:MAG: endonuclease/exonuclease/phosphatase family protein [Thermoanaerobaculia bacterium]|nr:endonuclease/exonuclease/phosphatase family protein [Thermoanaerobaculia bacterium]
MKNIIAVITGLFLSLHLFAQKGEFKIAAIGFYNLENLFDTLDSPTTNDADFLPGGRLHWNSEKYWSKQGNMAKVISQLGTEKTPDGLALLGVCEIENRSVLEDLVAQPLLKSRNYQIVHYESPDERGIDVGLLYQPKYFTVTGSKSIPVYLFDKDSARDYTRDVLYVSGKLDGEPLHVLVNHWPSRSGGESASAWRRAEAARICRQVVDSLTALEPNAKIIIMGDLNDDPNNKSLTQVLRAVRSTDKMKEGEMYNPMYDLFMNGDGTLAYRDAWNLFDQTVLSRGLVWKKAGGWQFFKPVVFRQPWLFQEEGAFRGYPLRTFVGDIFLNGYSDHLPVYFYLIKKR